MSKRAKVGSIVDFTVKATGELKHGIVIEAYVDGGYSIQCKDSDKPYDVYENDIVYVY